MSPCPTTYSWLCSAARVPFCSNRHCPPAPNRDTHFSLGLEHSEPQSPTPSPLPGFCPDVSLSLRPSLHLLKTAIAPNLQTLPVPCLCFNVLITTQHAVYFTHSLCLLSRLVSMLVPPSQGVLWVVHCLPVLSIGPGTGEKRMNVYGKKNMGTSVFKTHENKMFWTSETEANYFTRFSEGLSFRKGAKVSSEWLMALC